MSTNDPPAWEATYRTQGSAPAAHETLVVRFRVGGATEYFYSHGAGVSATNVPVSRADIPLAGSDFWLTDLGLEFLHWPNQRVLRSEMRRGRSCRVLESTHPNLRSQATPGCFRGWTTDTDGILQAEAYGPDGRMLKEFSVGSFKKIEGQWQLKDMKIRSVRRGSRTWLEFDLRQKG